MARRRTGHRLPRGRWHQGELHTETYAALKVEIDTTSLGRSPFYLRTGKRLGKRVTEIAVVFQTRAAPSIRRDRDRGARSERDS